jgi:hypothetical protein
VKVASQYYQRDDRDDQEDHLRLKESFYSIHLIAAARAPLF